MNIIREVKKLNLPLGKYIIIGSSSLAVRGIGVTPKDIDILVQPKLFQKLSLQKSFQKKSFPDGKTALIKDYIEIVLGTPALGFEAKAVTRLIKNAKIIDGVPFSNLYDEMELRKRWGRDKDAKYISLIESHLSKCK